MMALARRGTLLSVVLCLLVVVAASPLLGQTFRGGIQGNLTDSLGGALPGTTVTITNTATKLTRTTVADEDGNYFIPELPLGDCSLLAELSGFPSQTVTGIHVSVGSRTSG